MRRKKIPQAKPRGGVPTGEGRVIAKAVNLIVVKKANTFCF